MYTALHSVKCNYQVPIATCGDCHLINSNHPSESYDVWNNATDIEENCRMVDDSSKLETPNSTNYKIHTIFLTLFDTFWHRVNVFFGECHECVTFVWFMLTWSHILHVLFWRCYKLVTSSQMTLIPGNYFLFNKKFNFYVPFHSRLFHFIS